MKLITENETLYEHAILRPKVTGQQFDFWVDEFGKNRKTKHNSPRYTVTANNIELDLILKPDNTVECVNDARTQRKFKHLDDAIAFIQKFSDPLRMQWNGDIDTYELATVIRLTEKQGYDILDALSKVASGNF